MLHILWARSLLGIHLLHTESLLLSPGRTSGRAIAKVEEEGVHCAPTRWVSRGGIYVEKSVIPAGAYSAGSPRSNDSEEVGINGSQEQGEEERQVRDVEELHLPHTLFLL